MIEVRRDRIGAFACPGDVKLYVMAMQQRRFMQEDAREHATLDQTASDLNPDKGVLVLKDYSNGGELRDVVMTFNPPTAPCLPQAIEPPAPEQAPAPTPPPPAPAAPRGLLARLSRLYHSLRPVKSVVVTPTVAPPPPPPAPPPPPPLAHADIKSFHITRRAQNGAVGSVACLITRDSGRRCFEFRQNGMETVRFEEDGAGNLLIFEDGEPSGVGTAAEGGAAQA